MQFKKGDKILNRYEVKAVLGGGMGDVYIALDTEWNQLFAIKTFKDEYLGNEEAINRFMREAETWVDLERHTNIVFANFVQRIPREYGKPYIFLEFIEGDERYGLDLRGYIAHLDIPQALDFAIQFCTGMSYALEKFPDLVHRDIKPDNVMITKERVAKITDFGLVKTLDESKIGTKMEKELKALCHTRTGSCFGTVPYMAPEQFVDAASVDTRADIYSFGVMLYEMLTTKLPFYAPNFRAYMNKHLKEIPEKPKALNHNIPDELDALVIKCLEKKPRDRYWCFKDLQKDLIEIYNELSEKKYIVKGEKEKLSEIEWGNKGASYAYLGLFEKAEDAYKTALRINPNDASAHNNLGVLLKDLKREEEAEREYREAIRLNQNFEKAHDNLGILLNDLNRFEEAEEEYRESIKINPNDAAAHNNLGALLKNLNREEEAEREYREAIRLNPNDAEMRHNLGNFLAGLNRFEEAEKEWREAIRLDPNDAQTHYNLGVLMATLKRNREAEKEMRIAIRLNPNYAEAHRGLGALYYDLNRYNDAKKELRIAARLYKEQGEYQEAEMLEKFL